MSAKVTSEMSGHTIDYRVEGTFDEVTAAIAEIHGMFPTPGYGTWFHWPPGLTYSDGTPHRFNVPRDLGDGRWEARGHRSTSCD